MLKKCDDTRKQIEFFSLEDLVPSEHLVRKVDKAIDFSFIYDEVKDLYDTVGKPSIDPVSLIKMVFIKYLFGIKSMRQTVKEIEVNLAYRWFCGFGLTDKVPHFTTFGKNYQRRFQGTSIFENIFSKILQSAIDNKFVDTSAIYIDSTHIKACANKKKKIEEYVKVETKNYQKILEKEINEDRESIGQKELKSEDKEELHKITKSTTDPDAGDFHKGEHEQMFAYSAHTVCDKNAFVLDMNVTPANKHDSTEFTPLFNKVKDKYDITYVGVDAGYKNPVIAKEIYDNDKIPLMPYTRPKGKNNQDFKYDKYYDYFTCSVGNLLEHTTTNKLGYREYASNSEMCKKCPNYEQCIGRTQNRKVMRRHIWQKYVDRANQFRYTQTWKELYPKRSETIERIFGDAKEKHGMRYTQLKGLKKVTWEVLLIFTCMNLKKLANWLWKRDGKPSQKCNIFEKILKWLKLRLKLA